MGFEKLDDNDGEGFAKFRQGDNAYIKLKQIKPEKDSYEGKEYQQLAMRFSAQKENEPEEQGTLPGWFNSKITIKESEEHTSALGNLLDKANVLEEVLEDLGADEETIEAIKSGEVTFKAEDSSENEELGKAVANSLKEVMLRAGTKHNSSSDYSIVKSVHGLADEDSSDEADGQDDTEDDESSDDKPVILDGSETEEPE